MIYILAFETTKTTATTTTTTTLTARKQFTIFFLRALEDAKKCIKEEKRVRSQYYQSNLVIKIQIVMNLLVVRYFAKIKIKVSVLK